MLRTMDEPFMVVLTLGSASSELERTRTRHVFRGSCTTCIEEGYGNSLVHIDQYGGQPPRIGDWATARGRASSCGRGQSISISGSQGRWTSSRVAH